MADAAALLAGVLAAPAAARSAPDADPQRRIEMAQLAATSLELRILWLGGSYAGYLALIPGAPRFAHLSLYLAPAARSGGRGWGFCRDLLGWLPGAGAALGLHAVAVQATTPGQARLCPALGAEFACDLPPRGPVFVLARVDELGRSLGAAEIARASMPVAFAAAEVLEREYRAAGLPWAGLVNQLRQSRGQFGFRGDPMGVLGRGGKLPTGQYRLSS